MYHADVEDRYMTAPLTDFQPARLNEAEHVELATLLEDLASYTARGQARELEQRVKAAIIALHDQPHTELMERLEDVLAVLDEETGRTRVIARTKRHLYGKVVALRICQDDHLESEEAFVLPEVRERLSQAQQLEIAKRLLINEEAEQPDWILGWLAKELTPGDGRLLNDLTARFESLSTAAD